MHHVQGPTASAVGPSEDQYWDVKVAHV